MRACACALLVATAVPAAAHRLDEYLQATTIAVEKGRIEAEIRLAPGISVLPAVFADIDRDADGAASATEQRAYAQRVLGDLSLSVDGRQLPLRLISWLFPAKELLQEGQGEIRLRIEADVPGSAARRWLVFENHHQSRIGAYLVNALVPRDPDIRLAAQQRSDDQSYYRLDYTDAGTPAGMLSLTSWSGPWIWMFGTLLALIAICAAPRARQRRGRGGAAKTAPEPQPSRRS